MKALSKSLTRMYLDLQKRDLKFQKELNEFAKESISKNPNKVFRKKVCRLAAFIRDVDNKPLYLTVDKQGFYDLITLKKSKGVIKVKPQIY